MQGLTQGCVIDAEIPSHGMDRKPPGAADAVDGSLDLVQHGQDVTGIARIAGGYPEGKDKASGGFREQPRFAAELRWAVAFAFEDRCNSSIIGIHDFTVVQPLALDQAAGLGADRLM